MERRCSGLCKCCTEKLDKQRVKEAIEKITSIDFVAEYPENKAGMVRIDNSDLKNKLLEELGLDDE